MANKFNRFVPEAGMKLLESRPEWWTELLAFRFRDASGMEQPLFLAARNGYMNAYIEGQSILKIAFDSSGDPAKLNARVHHKYLRDGAEGSVYLRFDGRRYFDKAGPAVIDAALATLEARVARARRHTGDEKCGVAVIVGKHPQVIDVEMGLPANASTSPGVQPTAPRMDIVALEEDGEGARIVFYEAKLFRNSELRAESLQAPVLTQLKKYVDWVKSPGRTDEVVSAYRQACRIHVRVHAMREPGSAGPVHPLIQRAASDGSLLKLDPEPRLIIFDYKPEARELSWKRHEEALRRAGIKLIMAPEPAGIVFS